MLLNAIQCALKHGASVRERPGQSQTEIRDIRTKLSLRRKEIRCRAREEYVSADPEKEGKSQVRPSVQQLFQERVVCHGRHAPHSTPNVPKLPSGLVYSHEKKNLPIY